MPYVQGQGKVVSQEEWMRSMLYLGSHGGEKCINEEGAINSVKQSLIDGQEYRFDYWV